MTDEPGGTPDPLPQEAWTARVLPPLGAAFANTVIFVAVLSIPLATAGRLELTQAETVGWIMAIYGVPGLATIVMVARHRQPMVITGNIFLLIFVASLGTDVPWAELIGASILAGAVVTVLGPLGVTKRITRWLPGPIVFGLLAGAVLHFFVDLFSATDDEPLIVGTTLAVYLVARRYLEPRVPALLPAMVTGIALAAAAGELGSASGDVDWTPAFTTPEFSLSAILTVMPVMVVLITIQANIPSAVLLRERGYPPPDPTINAVSGLGTGAGSLLGPMGVSLSLPATALASAPEAGAHADRHWAALLSGATMLGIGLAAGLATEIATVVPRALLVALVGLAILGILVTSLKNVMEGPLVLGPLFAFAIAQSSLEIGDLGPFFWALVGGLAVSLLLEADGWRELRTA